jgi:uncharacterized protein YdeI (YjbR/CyaY-like superfamily)
MTNLPTKPFVSAAAFRAWLAKNGAKSTGIWMKLYKRGSGKASITYAEAVDEALCYGWIDGQKAKGDDEFWLQKFTPRRPRSIWSKRNIEHCARLTKAGKMTPAGQAQIDAAQADGRWAAAYESPSTMEIPAAFLALLKKNAKAQKHFASLNRTNLYAIAFRLPTAKKPETLERRMADIIQRLAKGEVFHPLQKKVTRS